MAERRVIPVDLSLEEAAEAMSVSVNGKTGIRIKLEDLEATPRQIPSARW